MALREILRLAASGWQMLPCRPQSKKPLLRKWPSLATSDPFILRRWSEEYPLDSNWGVATGKASNLFVLDSDGQRGQASLAALENEHGPLPPTLTVITGGGGEHRYFRYPANGIRNSTALLGVNLDIRGQGGMALVPPSIHPSGSPYRFVDESVPIADAPDWLFDVIAENSARPIYRRTLIEGERNDNLVRYAGWLRSKGAELPEIERRLLAANQRRCIDPLDEKAIRAMARSAAKWAVGAPDPLEEAWRAIEEQVQGQNNEERFLALCRSLQKLRNGLEIALPLRRIAELLDIHWTTVSLYRKSAVRQGILTPTSRYIAKMQAGRYKFCEIGRKINIAPQENKIAGRPALAGAPPRQPTPERPLPASLAALRSQDANLSPLLNLSAQKDRKGPLACGGGKTTKALAPAARASLKNNPQNTPHTPITSLGRIPERSLYSTNSDSNYIGRIGSSPAPSLNSDPGQNQFFDADKILITQARARGEALGFTGIGLSDFIEREVRLQTRAGRRSRKKPPATASRPDSKAANGSEVNHVRRN